MKKTIAFLLAVFTVFAMAGCRSKQPPQSLSGTMEETVNKLVQANPAQFMGGLIPLDLTDTTEDGRWALKSYTGLDSAEKITDAAVYEPMTGSQAFSLVLVRVADVKETKAVAQQMKDNIDPRKWICATADEVIAAGFGDTVVFIMLDSALGQTAQSYVDAYAQLCGSKPDFTI